MSLLSVIPLLLALLIVLLFSLGAWGAMRLRRRPAEDVPLASQDHVLIGFLLVGVFALAIFLVFAFVVSTL